MVDISDVAIRNASSYNETEVRFHIIDPILRSLGYGNGDDVYLYLEEQLEYPYLHIGRRSKRDQPIGIADYRAGVKGARGSFVVEAKAGSVSISERDIEQAHSYAAHAQVGANYFVICNGIELLIFETLSGSAASPIVDIKVSEISNRFHEVQNILAPRNLIKYCTITYDRGLPMADGLGSSARIRTGRYKLSEYDLKILVGGRDCTEFIRQSVPKVAEMEQHLELLKTSFELRISDGSVTRGSDGKIIAHVKFDGATISNEEAMMLLGIREVTFVTNDKFISTDSGNPTIFETRKDIALARGASMPTMFGEVLQTPSDLKGGMFIKAAMYLRENHICGEYKSLSNQEMAGPGGIQIVCESEMVGTFELKLDV